MAALPIIDLREIGSPDELAAELLRVGKDPGFFYLVGHRVSADIFDVCRDFFSNTPLAEKKVYWTESGDKGYTGMRDESLAGKGNGDLKESFYIASEKICPDQQLPPKLQENREQIEEFISQCENTARILLEGFALGLELKSNFLSKHHGGKCNRLRLIHYPEVPFTAPDSPISTTEATPQPDTQTNSFDEKTDIRAGAHSDYGSLTLLFQQATDQGGLQVLQHGGVWRDVPYLEDAIVVNIGDALEFWTSGQLRSTVHRVVFPRTAAESGSRFSIPFFVQPDAEVLLAPLPLSGTRAEVEERASRFQCVLQEKGYREADPITAGEHLRRRLQATY
ncbi:hypothetical protein BP5796_09791 [Coleophoma crateriformis]|uniref:Fe2OG dioxygenase domain-containing protein n=1 Tax=Coleophoma crateriformis TaxID=565419 RepID=A0A3D8QZ08_9HELO|nr:hypothetical protein BP5796_09791 [Coleophoma crateriformis]